MNEYTKYVGLDTHKDTIAVAVALADRQPPHFHGEIPNTPESSRKLLHKLSPQGEVLAFCYEVGPCGYEIHRQLITIGHVREVVAPSLIPKKSGERVKTDRRDALQLARLYRPGELTPIWVPDQEQESMRDLPRASEDLKAFELKARQRLEQIHADLPKPASRIYLSHSAAAKRSSGQSMAAPSSSVTRLAAC